MPDRSPLSLSVLGPLEVVREGEPARLGPKLRRVLALLTVHANEVVSADRLIDVLWGDSPPATASHTLHSRVSDLRKELGADRIETRAPGYRLLVDGAEVDSLRFDELVRLGLDAGDQELAATAFEEALALWRGRPFAEFADEEFASAEVTRLTELRACAVEEHARALIDLVRPAEVIGSLAAEIQAEPLREQLRAVMMLALARAGRPVEALRAFDAYRQWLADEVGVPPSPELQALNDDILRQQPGLGWQRPSNVAGVDDLPTGTVTFVFTDVEGSTRLWQEHPDAMADALARHDAIVRDAVANHHGRVVKSTGDGVHAVFAVPSNAVDAAVDAQRSLHAEVWGDIGSLRVRIGLHAGAATLRDGDYDGTVVNQAARLMGTAHGGQIVCSGAVAELLGDHVELLDLGAHRLRDLEAAMRVFQVIAAGLETRFPPLNSLDARRSNLPHELSALVGRVDDITAVAKTLGETRVVSIVGTGGVGKSRVALRVGAHVMPEYADGVWWCELAAVRDPDTLAEAVATVLEYSPSPGVALLDGLVGFFRHKQLLLVLDNCEHLIDAVATFVRTMTENAPGLSVLMTSREAVAIRGERTYSLPPLQLPVDASPFEVEASEAGALFVARAREARSTFVVTADNAAAIADVCARLDANALAIELAAARTPMMSPADILSRLDQRFRLLTGRNRDAADRHQTLHAAISWSYALLDAEEQALLQRLSVFVGDFDMRAATAIAADAGLDEFDAVDRLGSLVAKSLVEHDETAVTSRYRLLESVREYAAEQLGAHGSTELARLAHAAHYLDVALHQFTLIDTAEDFEALDHLRVVTPNLAAGLRALLDAEQSTDVLAFFADVGWIDTALLPYALLDELGRVADEAVARSEASGARGEVEARFYTGARAFYVGDWELYQRVSEAVGDVDPASPVVANLRMGAATMRADLEAVQSICGAAVQRAREAEDLGCLSYMLAMLAMIDLEFDPERARAEADEAVSVARRGAAASALIYPLFVLANVARLSDPARALSAADECVGIDRTPRKAWSTLSEGLASLLRTDRGELDIGLRQYRKVLDRLQWSGEVGYLSMQLPGLADAIAGTDPMFALGLFSISESGVIAPWTAFEVFGGYERLARMVDELGPAALQGARAQAAAMTYDEAVQYVFDGIDRLIDEAPTSTSP